MEEVNDRQIAPSVALSDSAVTGASPGAVPMQPRRSSKVTLISNRSSRIGTSRILPRTEAVYRMPMGLRCRM
jgi:hypothetical protein